jgi:hypothetical protein
MAAAKTEAQVQAIKKQFLVPSGPGWTVTRQRDDEQMTLVVRRTAPLAPGETVRQDMVVRGIVNGQPGGQVVNEVAVRPAGPARVEYRETLRWQGKRPDEFFQPQPNISKTVRAALPAPLAADDKAVGAVAVQVQQELWRAAFGPGEPLIVIFPRPSRSRPAAHAAAFGPRPRFRSRNQLRRPNDTGGAARGRPKVGHEQVAA